MIKWFENRFIRGAAVVSGVYWLFAAFLDGEYMISVANSILVGVAVAVVITWGPSAWRAFKEGGKEGWQQLVAAPVITLIPIILLRMYVALVRAFDFPESWVNSPVIGYMLITCACGCMLYLSSPGTTGGVTPPKNWFWIAVSVGIGALIAGIGIGGVLWGSYLQEAEDTRRVLLSHSRPSCPLAAAIKGNVSGRGRIFHVPGSFQYEITIPERCFATVDAAVSAGYRPPG